MGGHTVPAHLSDPMDTARQGITSITVTVRTTPDSRAVTRLARAIMGSTSETVPRN